MSRITYKMVKQWLSESSFAVSHGMHISSWNGYYYILDDCNNTRVSAKTPGELWEKFNLLKTGYYLAQQEQYYKENNKCIE